MPTATTTRATRAGSQVADTASRQSRQVAGQAAEQARDVATTASERGGAVVGQAKQDARQIAGLARERVSEVTEQATQQARSLVEETRTQLETQAKSGAQRAAGAFRDIGNEAQALAEGRPEDAPNLSEYAFRAADACFGVADRLAGLGDEVETRGFTGVLGDVQTYARRRPGAFLLGAVALGFGVGRIVKAEQAGRKQNDDGGDYDDEEYTPNGRLAPRRAITTRTAR